jgi:hypothetical protein
MAKKKLSPTEQSARFREAAREAGGDQKSFEKAFKKIVPAKTGPKKAGRA